jgi:hypothetical protein
MEFGLHRCSHEESFFGFSNKLLSEGEIRACVGVINDAVAATSLVYQ